MSREGGDRRNPHHRDSVITLDMIQLNVDNGIPIEAAQVRDGIKKRLSAWLLRHEFRLAEADAANSAVLFKCYHGEFVSVSLTEQVGAEQTKAFNAAKRAAVSDYWRNEEKDDDTFWVHRQWVDDLEASHSV